MLSANQQDRLRCQNWAVYLVSLYGNLTSYSDPRGRTPLQIKGYHQYLDAFCADIARTLTQHSQLRVLVVLCGGFTSKEDPELSESASVFDYVADKLSTLLTVERLDRLFVIIEHESINSVQNIAMGIETAEEFFLQQYPPGPTVSIGTEDIINLPFHLMSVIVCCDRARIGSNLYAARHLFAGADIDLMVVGYPRRDDHIHSHWIVQLGKSLVFRWLPSQIDKQLFATKPS